MENLQEKMANILKNDPVERHSLFQLRYFVVGKEPTTQAKMWRCITELKSRKENIEAIQEEMKSVVDKRKLAEMDRDEAETILATSREKERDIIKLRIMERQIKVMAKSMSDLEKKLASTEEEAAFFVQCFTELSKTEQLKPWDDKDAQTEYWSQKLAQDINLRMLLRQPIDTELVKTILCMEDSAPIKVQTQKMLEKVKEIEGQVMRARLASQGVKEIDGGKNI